MNDSLAGNDAGAISSADAGKVSLDPPDLDVVLLDARLTAAADRFQDGDFSGAAKIIEEVRSRSQLDGPHVCSWSYVEGQMHAAANEPMQAILSFDRAGGAPDVTACPLASYARLRSSQAWLKTGHADEAIARVRLVPDDIALASDAKLVLADALALKGDRTAAAALWRAYLAMHNHDGRFVDVSVKLGQALVDGVLGDPKVAAKEARELATRVLVYAPSFETSAGAINVRTQAIGLDSSLAATLTPEQKQKRAQAWLDSSHADKAFAESSSLYAQIVKTDPDLACKVATTRAQASAHTKASSIDAWENAITSCEIAKADDAYAAALYNAAKAAASKKPDLAIVDYEKLERLFPNNRLADDARLRAAMIWKDKGDDARSLSMLTKLADDYPNGDMHDEATFRVALSFMSKGDWDAAVPFLDRVLATSASDHHWATSGRAAYFRARAFAKKGELENAKSGYRAIINERPLAFYALLAFARLSELDEVLAKKTLADAEAREAASSVLTSERSEVKTVAFERALRLLEVGETNAAKREMIAAKTLSDTADAELVWYSAILLDRACAPELGSAWSRVRVQDYLSHYPVGRYRSMWEAAFPKAFENIVARNASLQKVPKAVVWGVMREESAFYPDATSSAAAYGLMQLIASTAKLVAVGTGYFSDESSLKKPATSIALGAKLLASLRTTFASNPALAIPAYNGGAGAVGRWMAARGTEDFDLFCEEIPWEETRGYTKRVLASIAAYAYLYEPNALEEIFHLPLRADGQKP